MANPVSSWGQIDVLGELTSGGDGTVPRARSTEGGTLSCDGVGFLTNGKQTFKLER